MRDPDLGYRDPLWARLEDYGTMSNQHWLEATRHKDAEIERLKKLIGELAEALASKEDDSTIPESEHYGPLLERARKVIRSNPHP